jgi:hypothetical protein
MVHQIFSWLLEDLMQNDSKFLGGMGSVASEKDNEWH